MNNYYWCTPYCLDPTQLEVYCHHGYNNPFEALENTLHVRIFDESALLGYCSDNSILLSNLEQQHGFSTSDMQNQLVVCSLSCFEGNEYIDKVILLSKDNKYDLDTINNILRDIHAAHEIRSIEAILAEAPNLRLSKQHEIRDVSENIDPKPANLAMDF